MKFIVEVPITGCVFYEVEADSEAQAEHLVHTGCAPFKDSDWDLDYNLARWNITRVD